MNSMSNVMLKEIIMCFSSVEEVMKKYLYRKEHSSYWLLSVIIIIKQCRLWWCGFHRNDSRQEWRSSCCNEIRGNNQLVLSLAKEMVVSLKGLCLQEKILDCKGDDEELHFQTCKIDVNLARQSRQEICTKILALTLLWDNLNKI